MAKILIKNGRIWDGEKFFYADVLTSDNKIEKIEPDICEKASFVYDASGKTVTAGLVDSHIHMRGISRDIYGAQAEMCCFPFGVTAAADAEAAADVPGIW
jgi:dihydroorotase-like cyclic amidohydrolase